MPRVFLAEVTSDDPGWKGTWYRKGQHHFVQQHPWWPQVVRTRWHALTPGVWGGIAESDCRILRGPLVWLRCLWFRFTERRAEWVRTVVR